MTDAPPIPSEPDLPPLPPAPDPVAERFEIEAWSDFLAAAPAPVARAAGVEILRLGGVTCFVAPGISSVEFNRAVGLGLDGPVGEAELEAVIEVYRSRSVGAGRIQIMEGGPQAAALAERLTARGATVASRWVMLGRAGDEAPEGVSPLAIRELGTAEAEASGRVFRRAYGLPEFFDQWTAAFVGRKDWRCFAAFDGAEMVSVAYLFQRGGRAILSGAATLPEARGKGAQKALLAARIAAAQAEGAGFIQSHTGLMRRDEGNPSLQNMLRAGLRPLHLRLNWTVPV